MSDAEGDDGGPAVEEGVSGAGGVKALLKNLNTKYADSHVQLPDGTVPTGKPKIATPQRKKPLPRRDDDPPPDGGAGGAGGDGGELSGVRARLAEINSKHKNSFVRLPDGTVPKKPAFQVQKKEEAPVLEQEDSNVSASGYEGYENQTGSPAQPLQQFGAPAAQPQYAGQPQTANNTGSSQLSGASTAMYSDYAAIQQQHQAQGYPDYPAAAYQQAQPQPQQQQQQQPYQPAQPSAYGHAQPAAYGQNALLTNAPTNAPPPPALLNKPAGSLPYGAGTAPPGHPAVQHVQQQQQHTPQQQPQVQQQQQQQRPGVVQLGAGSNGAALAINAAPQAQQQQQQQRSIPRTTPPTGSRAQSPRRRRGGGRCPSFADRVGLRSPAQRTGSVRLAVPSGEVGG
mmetsp:Transcript_187/g.513  ORF Transcript_187/g.513 Transcript_187/m.513 type:complete len:397 (+) Transcript_187:113-1303(+)